MRDDRGKRIGASRAKGGKEVLRRSDQQHWEKKDIIVGHGGGKSKSKTNNATGPQDLTGQKKGGDTDCKWRVPLEDYELRECSQK